MILAAFMEVTEHRYIGYTIGDGRKVKLTFDNNGSNTHITESFEAEKTHSLDAEKRQPIRLCKQAQLLF